MQRRRTTTDVAATLPSAARWRGRVLARKMRHRVPGERAELRLLADCCGLVLVAIEGTFDGAAAGAVARTPDRRSVDELLARMQAIETAVQRAHAAGVAWDAIQDVTQLAWPLACEVFEVLGWAEAFRAEPDACPATGPVADLVVPVARKERDVASVVEA